MNSIGVKFIRKLMVGQPFFIKPSKSFPDIIEGVAIIVSLVKNGLKPENYQKGGNFDSDVYDRIAYYIEGEVGSAKSEEKGRAIKEELENQAWVVFKYENGGFSVISLLPVSEFINHISSYY